MELVGWCKKLVSIPNFGVITESQGSFNTAARSPRSAMDLAGTHQERVWIPIGFRVPEHYEGLMDGCISIWVQFLHDPLQKARAFPPSTKQSTLSQKNRSSFSWWRHIWQGKEFPPALQSTINRNNFTYLLSLTWDCFTSLLRPLTQRLHNFQSHSCSEALPRFSLNQGSVLPSWAFSSCFWAIPHCQSVCLFFSWTPLSHACFSLLLICQHSCGSLQHLTFTAFEPFACRLPSLFASLPSRHAEFFSVLPSIVQNLYTDQSTGPEFVLAQRATTDVPAASTPTPSHLQLSKYLRQMPKCKVKKTSSRWEKQNEGYATKMPQMQQSAQWSHCGGLASIFSPVLASAFWIEDSHTKGSSTVRLLIYFVKKKHQENIPAGRD